jgi:hypothetical protein
LLTARAKKAKKPENTVRKGQPPAPNHIGRLDQDTSMAANAADKLPPEQPVEEEAGDAPPATTRKRPATGEPDAASSKRARQSPTPRNGANSEGDEGADDEEKPEVSDGSAEPNEESEGEKSSNVRPTFRVALLDIGMVHLKLREW